MPMSLYRATASVGPFRAGEYVQIDPAEWADEIEMGWLYEPNAVPANIIVDEPWLEPEFGTKKPTK